jgi:glutamyl-tRNA synthetase/glutamyl-Q tRNA(Asp) synthetase
MTGSAGLTRFAPAPTGYLHLGHVANAIFVWGMAGATGRRVVLRVEDHDRQRSRVTYEQALLDDLDWLGFTPHVFPSAAFRAGACDGRQSDRQACYDTAARRLDEAGLLYGCTCSRQDLGTAPPDVDGERAYAGTCRSRGVGLVPDVAWRLRLGDGAELFDDLILGPQRQEHARQCGDVVIRDRLGNWTYQFVASVDDWLMGVDLVVRGRDLLPSTGRQIRLARLLGRPEPARFAHHPLIMKSPAQKLSKSDRDTGVRDLRTSGWSAARVIGEAAFRVGLADRVRELRAEDVTELLTA